MPLYKARLAELRDVPVIVDMCQALYEESPYKKKPFNILGVKNKIEEIITGPIDKSLGLVTEDDGVLTGGLGAITTELFHSGELIASEIFWWVYPEYRKTRAGILLLDAYEYWARTFPKVDRICMGNITTQKDLSKLYTRKGYTKIEEIWIK